MCQHDHLINGTKNSELICGEIREDLEQKTSCWHLWVLLQEENCGLEGLLVNFLLFPFEVTDRLWVMRSICAGV